MIYRNIQGLRAIAALIVLASHLFWDIVPMRTHWAKPYLAVIGFPGVDIFFVISGFIIYHVMQRAAQHALAAGRAGIAADFALKRCIRIYPLYWIVFAAACLIMRYVPATAMVRKPTWELLTLIDSLPNFRVEAAWTLTFEIYFYAVATLSLWLSPRRPLIGLTIWFSVVAAVTTLATSLRLSVPLDYLFAPIVLEFLLGILVARLIERQAIRYVGPCIVFGSLWLLAGSWYMQQAGAAIAASYVWRLGCRGIPAAFIVYGVVALETTQRWTMPRVLQYLGNASYSIYLWHAVVFLGLAQLFVKLGLVGTVHSSLLAVAMGCVGLLVGLASYHALEKPLLQWLSRRLLTPRRQPMRVDPLSPTLIRD